MSSIKTIEAPPINIANILNPCRTADQLWILAKALTGHKIPRQPICPHHNAPFDYLLHAYNVGTDVVVHAPRGGGKTFLGALATLLDMLHKPAINIRILGGSLDQSNRMWEHLQHILFTLSHDITRPPHRSGLLRLFNNSFAAVLPQSQRAVRGLRIQKLRCDEVELFDPAVWTAAQLTTRSRPGSPSPFKGEGGGIGDCPRPGRGEGKDVPSQLSSDSQPPSPGSIEAFSTLHTPSGLMQKILDNAAANNTRIIRWCLLEVLEHCPEDRDCHTCPLWNECQGIAKDKCDGFLPIDDAIAMKRRVSQETWDAEMLCRRPATRGAVFPTFDPALHVRDSIPAVENSPDRELHLSIDFGYAAPFVCLFILETGRLTFILDEYVQEQRLLEDHITQIRERPWGTPIQISCDPAGNSRNDQTGQSNIALLKRAGYTVRAGPSRIVDGLEHIRRALHPALGQPSLFIHPRCTRLIHALRAYRHAESGSELPFKDGQHDHLIDALRYHFANRHAAPPAGRRY